MEVRCHTSSAVEPVLAVADSEGGVNLVRWSTSEVFLVVHTRGTPALCVEASSNTVPKNCMWFGGHALPIFRLG